MLVTLKQQQSVKSQPPKLENMELYEGFIKIITITPLKTTQANVKKVKDLVSKTPHIFYDTLKCIMLPQNNEISISTPITSTKTTKQSAVLPKMLEQSKLLSNK